MSFSPEEIEKFVREYVTKLHELVTGKFADVKTQGYNMGIPLQFPVSVEVFQTERGLFFYFEPSEFFDFKMINKNKKATWSFFELAGRFNHWKNRGYDKAIFDINRLYYLPEQYESFHKEDEERGEDMEAQYVEDITAEIEYYIEYIKESHKIIGETVENNIYELYELFEIIMKYPSRMDLYIKTKSLVCLETWSIVMNEVENAFFLMLHGKYYSALNLLRKVFEIPCRAIFIDFKLKTDTSYEEYKRKLYEGENFPIMFKTMINRLIDNQEVNLIKSFLISMYGEEVNIKTKLIDIYKELSSFVHFVPREELMNYTFSFAEYNENEFKNFYKKFIEVINLTDILYIFKNPSIYTALNKYDFPNIGSSKMEELIQIIKEAEEQ